MRAFTIFGLVVMASGPTMAQPYFLNDTRHKEIMLNNNTATTVYSFRIKDKTMEYWSENLLKQPAPSGTHLKIDLTGQKYDCIVNTISRSADGRTVTINNVDICDNNANFYGDFPKTAGESPKISQSQPIP